MSKATIQVTQMVTVEVEDVTVASILAEVLEKSPKDSLDLSENFSIYDLDPSYERLSVEVVEE